MEARAVESALNIHRTQLLRVSSGYAFFIIICASMLHQDDYETAFITPVDQFTAEESTVLVASSDVQFTGFSRHQITQCNLSTPNSRVTTLTEITENVNHFSLQNIRNNSAVDIEIRTASVEAVTAADIADTAVTHANVQSH